MVDLPKRGSSKYTEMKEFQYYELTHCVVYEMAKRNKKVQDMLEILDYLEEFKNGEVYTNVSKRFILITPEEEEQFLALSKYNLAELRHELENMIDWDSMYENLRKNNSIKIEKSDADFIYNGGGYYNVSKDKRRLVEGYIEIIIAEIKDDLVNNYLIYPEGYISNFQGADEDYLHEVETQELTEIGTTFTDGINESVYKGFCILQEMNENSDNQMYAVNHIIPNFKRKIHNSNQIATLLNFSLPLNEIIDYITHIKNTLDHKDNIDTRIIKSPVELLGEELDNADDIDNMCSENRNGNLKCFDGRKGLLRTEKLADMFFIYDCVRAGYKKLKIMTAIDEFYDPDGVNEKSMHGDTYNKYLLIAKDYINNERYKELITGVKESKNI